MNKIGTKEKDFYSRRPIPASSDFVYDGNDSYKKVRKDSPDLELLKRKVRILDVVRKYVKINVKKNKNGRLYYTQYGLCPLHVENMPSFAVSLPREIYHCFGCGKGGDVFDFVQKMENVDFAGAVKILKKMYGIKSTGVKYGKIYKKKYFDILKFKREDGSEFEELVFLEDEISQKVQDIIYQEREEKYSKIYGKDYKEVTGLDFDLNGYGK